MSRKNRNARRQNSRPLNTKGIQLSMDVSAAPASPMKNSSVKMTGPFDSRFAMTTLPSMIRSGQ